MLIVWNWKPSLCSGWVKRLQYRWIKIRRGFCFFLPDSNNIKSNNKKYNKAPPDLPERGGNQFAKVKLKAWETVANGLEKVKTKVCKMVNNDFQDNS